LVVAVAVVTAFTVIDDTVAAEIGSVGIVG
jgi:hypothetical protein